MLTRDLRIGANRAIAYLYYNASRVHVTCAPRVIPARSMTLAVLEPRCVKRDRRRSGQNPSNGTVARAQTVDYIGRW